MGLAFGGLLYSTGYSDRPPIRPGNSLADYQTAMTGAFAVMLALYNRDINNGEGQQIDLALYETVFRFMDVLVPAYDKLGIKRERRGNLAFAAAPGEHFQTLDGRYIVVTVSSNSVFRRLCHSLGQPELTEDPRFATHENRCTNLIAINQIVADWIGSSSTQKVCETFDKDGVAYAIVFSIEDIFSDPHYAARGNIISVEHPRIGRLKIPAPIPRLLGTPAVEPSVAPELGFNSVEIYRDLLGLSLAEISLLREKKII